MPNRLAALSMSPVMREFAQGAAQSAIQPIGDFIAPTVNVGTAVGRYKVYSEKNRFYIPNTLRGVGGRAVELSFTATDATYNCVPHALDFPVDNLEALEEAGLENTLQEGAQMIAEVGALSHEKDVIVLAKAVAAATAGGSATWATSAIDPVKEIDTGILAVIKAAKYGSRMVPRIVFGAQAFVDFKNAYHVKAKFISAGRSPAQVAIPTMENIRALFVGEPEVMVALNAEDTKPEGVAETAAFLLDTDVLIFAANPNPTRRDPSYMKTFRLANQWMVPGSYVRDDGRVEVAKFDWSEHVVVTNSAAVYRISGA